MNQSPLFPLTGAQIALLERELLRLLRELAQTKTEKREAAAEFNETIKGIEAEVEDVRLALENQKREDPFETDVELNRLERVLERLTDYLDTPVKDREPSGGAGEVPPAPGTPDVPLPKTGQTADEALAERIRDQIAAAAGRDPSSIDVEVDPGSAENVTPEEDALDPQKAREALQQE